MWVYKFKNHKKIKNKLLSLIEDMPNEPIEENYVKVDKSDWNLPKNFERPYLDFFYDNFNHQMNEICSDFNCIKWEIHNGWFQQYKKMQEHKWHTHQQTNLGAVYYLELPSEELATEFFDKSKPKIKEGDIIFFPAHMLHRSPKNKTNKRKTVIAFNCDFYEWRENNEF